MLSRTRTLFAYSVAAASVVAGICSLALFGLFLWTGALGFIDLQMTSRPALAWDALLCALFFLQHSVMVRKRFHAWLARGVPEYCHGVVYTLCSALCLVLLVAYWQPTTAYVYHLDGAERWLPRAALLLCFVGVVWGIRSLGEFDAFGAQALLSHVRREQPQPGALKISGLYRWVRHPFYFCGIVALWATPVLTSDRLLLNFLFTGWIVLGAKLEERDLLAQFGDGYSLYQREVPMLFPRPPARVAARRASSGRTGL